MHTPTTRVRPALAAFGFVAAALAMTGAALFETADHRVLLDGTDNRFALVSAASFEPDWAPTPSDWRSASIEPIALDLSATQRELLATGQPVQLVIAARNAAPLSGSLSLHLSRPDGMTESDFAALRFTVVDGDHTMLADTPGDRVPVLQWADSFDAEDVKQLRVALTAPAGFALPDGSPLVDFRFEGVNR